MDTEQAPDPIPSAEYHTPQDGKSFIDLLDESFPVLDSEEAKKGGVEDPLPDPLPVAKEKAKKEPVADPPADPVAKEQVMSEADDFFAEDKEGEHDKDTAAPEADKAFDEEDFDKQTDELSKGLEMKAGEKFKSLRAELKEAKQTALQARPAPELEKEIEDLRLKARELEGLRSKVEELSNVSAKAKLEADDEYRAKVLSPSADIAASINELSASYEIDPKILKSIVAASDRKEQNALIEEYLVNFSELDRQEVYGHIRDFRNISKLRESMLENAGKKITEMEARKVEEEKLQREEKRKNVQTLQKSIWDKYQKILPGLVDEDGTPNETYQKLVNRSMTVDFSKSRGSDEAFAAFAGVAMPHVLEQMKALQTELETYRKKDQKALQSKPRVNQSSAPAGKSSDDTRSFVDRFADASF